MIAIVLTLLARIPDRSRREPLEVPGAVLRALGMGLTVPGLQQSAGAGTPPRPGRASRPGWWCWSCSAASNSAPRTRSSSSRPSRPLKRQAVPSSGLSLLGLVRHAAEVERSSFGMVVNGEDLMALWPREVGE